MGKIRISPKVSRILPRWAAGRAPHLPLRVPSPQRPSDGLTRPRRHHRVLAMPLQGILARRNSGNMAAKRTTPQKANLFLPFSGKDTHESFPQKAFKQKDPIKQPPRQFFGRLARAYLHREKGRSVFVATSTASGSSLKRKAGVCFASS